MFLESAGEKNIFCAYIEIQKVLDVTYKKLNNRIASINFTFEQISRSRTFFFLQEAMTNTPVLTLPGLG